LIAALLTLAGAAQAQGPPVWMQLEGSPFNEYRNEDLFFLNEARGWSVHGAGGGTVWRTLDGGGTWTLTATLDGYLRSVGFADEDLGWVGVLFSAARLYETRDGGLSFDDVTDRIQPPVPGGICSLWVVDDEVAYGAGQYAGPAYLIQTNYRRPKSTS